MSKIDLNRYPYYDDYDSTKEYYALLAVPGRVAQAREFTQAQSLARDIIKSVGDAIMKDGDVIEGCQVNVSADKKSATISAGRVYMDGAVLPLEETVIGISGIGLENIGVIINDEIIDETEDPSLRDPAQGFENYNLPGCHRLKRTLQVVVNDPSAAILSTLNEGDLMLETYSPEYDTLSQTLARRTFDESGSYIVKGLSVHVEDDVDPANYIAVVEAGKAYVLGYELGIATTRRLKVARSTAYDLVNVSSFVYTGLVPRDYKLDDDLYVRDIVEVTGTASATITQSISVGTEQKLIGPNVIAITQVNVGTKIYRNGIDYQLVRDGTQYYIKWLNQDYPDPGVAYTLRYTYVYTFIQDSDYSLVAVDGAHYLRWLDGGDTPLINTNFTVRYNQYLARKDVVYIDQYGNIAVKEGIPAEYGFEAAPEVPMDTLPLAVIVSPPNGSAGSTSTSQKIATTNVGLVRFTMQDIKEMLNRIRTLEYDQAVLSLNDDANRVYTENEKKGVFTEPFIDLSRCDLSYNLDTDGSIIDITKPLFSMAIDVEMNLAYLQVDENFHDASYNPSNTTAMVVDRIATLGKTGEVLVLSQDHATKSFLVNPYSMYPGIPSISITPQIDVWIEERIIEVPISLTNKTIVSTSTKTVRSSKRIHKVFKTYTKTSSTSKTSEVGTRVETFTEDSVISEEEITYIRPREITVSGSNFPWGLDNIKGYFDGKEVYLTPIGSTSAGTLDGTVKADSNGNLNCKFMIPEGVRTGEREVRLQSTLSIDGYLNFGVSIYQAFGTARTIERTVKTVTTVLLTKTTTVYKTTYVDPVGQSFVVPEKSLICGVDIYFEAKPDTLASITAEIRGVTNGMINGDILAQCTLFSTDVSVSSDASLPTRFNFDDNPALVDPDTQYAIVLRSESDLYRVWVAEMGDYDVQTGEQIMKNPYLSGVFYSSSNNSAWSIHQTTDLKFKLYQYTYALSGTVNFHPITVPNASMLTVLADSLSPIGTEVEWLYSVDGSNYKPITVSNTVNLDVPTNSVYLRANMTRESNVSLTPILALDSVGVLSGKFIQDGDYIFKNIYNLDDYDEVKIIAETYVPEGTSLTFYISRDDGETWDPVTDAIDVIARNYGWYEYTYQKKYTTYANQMRLRIKAHSDSTMYSPAVRRYRAIATEVVQP